MSALYSHTIHHLDQAFRKLEGMVPPPQKVHCVNGVVFRYHEKTIHQAIIQKLARVVTGLHAARLLYEHGFVQEQGVIQRTLDELHEDILFLSFGVLNGEQTALHQEYLEEFYKEENNRMVPRGKIREYVAAIISAGGDQSSAVAVYRSLYGKYSGFVHGASTHIMDLYQGQPARFQIHGVSGTPLHKDHAYDLHNPFFRAIIAFAVAAKAFGDDELCQKLHLYHLEFDQLSGRNEAYRGETESPSGDRG